MTQEGKKALPEATGVALTQPAPLINTHNTTQQADLQNTLWPRELVVRVPSNESEKQDRRKTFF